MKRLLVRSGPPSQQTFEGSSPSRLNGYKPAVNGNSQHFSCKHQRKISPQALYFGNNFWNLRMRK
jgi:hypothetical protein